MKKMMKYSVNYLSLKMVSPTIRIDEEIKTSKFMMETNNFLKDLKIQKIYY